MRAAQRTSNAPILDTHVSGDLSGERKRGRRGVLDTPVSILLSLIINHLLTLFIFSTVRAINPIELTDTDKK